MNISSVSSFPTGCILLDRPVAETHVAKYVGMYLGRLTSGNCAQRTAEKSKKNNVLKRLAGRKWDSSKSLLIGTCKAYINLPYGVAVRH
jgi:hypothetical protein